MSHLSTLKLHQYRYDELPPEERDLARAHLDVCTRCSGRLVVQERERGAFVVQPVPTAIQQAAEADRQSTTSWVPSWLRAWLPMAGALAAAAVVFAVMPQVRSTLSPTSEVSFKGELPSLEAWVDVGAGPRAVRAGERLGSGARVQLLVDGRGSQYVTLVGVDASGAVEIYGGFRPTPGAGLQPAPFALTLDDSPRQAFFAVGSEGPVDEAVVKGAIRSGVTAGLDVTRIEVSKEAQRR